MSYGTINDLPVKYQDKKAKALYFCRHLEKSVLDNE